MNIKPQDIAALIELFESSNWDELHLKIQDFELFLSTNSQARAALQSSSAAVPAPSPSPGSAVTPPSGTAEGILDAGSTADRAPVPAHWVAVTAPNLGTFYRSPKPGSPPFVELGQAVEPQTELCLIEVMKLFTTLKAGVKGAVKRVCAKDAAMVEFGDILFYIEPA
jgi:acetyl-CoA carboxylase biotin carboxyl carrier protein